MFQLKRRQTNAESEDETPLFSPSPSPSDEETTGTSLDRVLSPTNVGRELLLKMGWKEGSGLGLGGFGMIDPVPISEKRGNDLTGIGKTSLDVRTIVSSTANRRTMESERQLHEDETAKERRLARVESRKAQTNDVNQALKTYRCELCEKQYDRPSTYEAHLNSYDHHHKKRFMEMKSNIKGRDEAAGMLDKKRERERKREEREMVKMAQAAGIQMNAAIGVMKNANPTVVLSSNVGVGSSSGGGWKKVVSNTMPRQSSDPAPTQIVPGSAVTGWRSAFAAKDQIFKAAEILPGGTEQANVMVRRGPNQKGFFRSSGFSFLETSQSPAIAPPPPPPSEAHSPPPPPEDDAPPPPPTPPS
ncbi:hypothetical protein CBS101457_004341 [Exobasidium rhododendri]|nr:hypothetical protein CBS101457_004341 [Exobasidium rhododendri]